MNDNIFTPQQEARRFSLAYTIVLENRTPQLTPIPNEEMLGLNAHFSKPLAWMEVGKYMEMSPNNAIGKAQNRHYRLMSYTPRRIKELICLLISDSSTITPIFQVFMDSAAAFRSSIRLRQTTLGGLSYICSTSFDDRLQAAIWLVSAKRLYNFSAQIPRRSSHFGYG